MRTILVFSVLFASLLRAGPVIRETAQRGYETQLNIPASSQNPCLNVDNGTLYADCLNNRIGIGTTNPQSQLDVIGNANFGSSVTASAFYGNGAGITGTPPSGAAGGELTGTYPNPTLSGI